MSKAKTENTELVAFQGKTDLAVRQERVGQGSENVRMEDKAIPRLKLLNRMSDYLIKGSPTYLEGAEEGMILNTVTGELYTNVFIVNLYFTFHYNVWRKQKFGGGLLGAFSTEQEARNAIIESGEAESNFDIVDNPTHVVMLLDSNGVPKGGALLDMPSSKVKVSRRWNSQIEEHERNGVPRFSAVWQLGSFMDEGKEGKFPNYTVEFVAQAPDEIYKAAAKEYDALVGSVFAPKENEVKEAA